MEYESGRTPREKRKNLRIGRTGFFALLVLLLAVSSILAAGYLLPEKTRAVAAALIRTKNTIAFFVFSGTPHFYSLVVEKNGNEYILKAGDVFDVSYRDEFIVKKIETDVLAGGGLSVDIEGTGSRDDFGRLVKGVELVDKTVSGGKGEGAGKGGGELNFRVFYKDSLLASIPIRVVVMPQDWLRYARESKNLKIQIDYLRRAAKMTPEDTNVRRMLGALYFKSGLTAEAIGQYKEVLRLKPDDASALSGLVQCFLKTGAYDEAIRMGQRSLAVNPGDGQLLADIARAWGGLGNWGKAISASEAALKLLPGNPDVLYMLGEAYEKSGNPGMAAKQYRLVLEKAPHAEPAAVSLSGILLKTGDFDGAIKLYGEMLKRKPREAAIYANLGFAWGARGNRREEIANYRKAVALKPGDPVIHFNLAVAYEKEKKFAEAGAEYKEALKLNPNDYEAAGRLADIRFIEKKYQEAAVLYEKIIRKNPRKAALYTRLGFSYAALKQSGRAAENWEKAVRYGETDPQVRANLGKIYAQGGNIRKEKALYEKMATQKPAEGDLTRLLEIYSREKNYDKALGVYRKLIKLNPRKASLYSGAAYLYGLKGDTDKQIEYCLLSLKYDPEDYDAHVNLGAAYEKKGLLPEALNSYTAAYRLNPESQTAAKNIPRIKIMIMRQKQQDSSSLNGMQSNNFICQEKRTADCRV